LLLSLLEKTSGQQEDKDCVTDLTENLTT